MNKPKITVTPYAKGAVVEHHGISEIILERQGTGQTYSPFIKDALRKGFGRYELKMGDDYCKRRLAWLAGATQIDGLVGQEVDLGVLDSKMEWSEARIVTLSPPKKMSMGM